MKWRDFHGDPVVKNPPSNAWDVGSIPGQGTKIPHAMGQLSPRATTTEPMYSGARVPQLDKENPRTTTREKPACRSEGPAHHIERSHVPQLRPDAAKKIKK